VKRILVVAALAGSIAAATAAPAGATDECNGLQVCVPVTGPWVVVPVGRSVPRPHVEFLLSCPKGFVVGGLDAELSRPGIDLSFQGKIGAPVNPGVTTSRGVVFVGTFVGDRSGGGPPTFRPHVGCMPSGGGGRVLTSLHVVPPGKPAIRRVFKLQLHVGSQSVTRHCAPGEELISATHATGFYMVDPPDQLVVSSVRVGQRVRSGQVSIRAQAGRASQVARTVVQFTLVCAGGQ
jgi:hypothetical protein